MNPNRTTRDCVYLLGGHDLEMQTIGELLCRHVSTDRIFDKQLDWNAKASDYAVEIDAAVAQGRTPVLIELKPDLYLPKTSVLIDHHNQRAGSRQPTSLQQVFAHLHLPAQQWTRWYALVSANDRGYVWEMQQIGASLEEMQRVRKADRLAQRITDQQEQVAKIAAGQSRTLCDGELTVVDLPHEKTAAVADHFERLLGGPGYQNLLVRCPASVSFFGRGSLIKLLQGEVPGGWWGGALPERGYWGHKKPVPEIQKRLVRALLHGSAQA